MNEQWEARMREAELRNSVFEFLRNTMRAQTDLESASEIVERSRAYAEAAKRVRSETITSVGVEAWERMLSSQVADMRALVGVADDDEEMTL